MEYGEMSAEEEHRHEIPLNNEMVNLRDGEFWVDLNDSQDNKSESQRTVQELRYELRKFKEENEPQSRGLGITKYYYVS